MTHTREQVLCKIDDARRRANDHITKAVAATSDEIYDYECYLARKAIEDWQTWGKVLKCL